MDDLEGEKHEDVPRFKLFICGPNTQCVTRKEMDIMTIKSKCKIVVTLTRGRSSVYISSYCSVLSLDHLSSLSVQRHHHRRLTPHATPAPATSVETAFSPDNSCKHVGLGKFRISNPNSNLTEVGEKDHLPSLD